jgi:hypothetical protein
MKDNITRSDMIACILTGIVLALMVVCNYFFNGGHLVW